MKIQPTFLNHNFIYLLQKDAPNEIKIKDFPSILVEYISYLPIDPNPFNTKPKFNWQPHLMNVNIPISFDECMHLSVMNLENANKDPILYWSGGLDSTAILVAIEKYGSKNLVKNLHIATTSMSSIENPEIFKHVVDTYEILSANQPMDTLAKRFIVIHGNGADQLYGTMHINAMVPDSGTKFLSQPHSYLDNRLLYTKYKDIINLSPTPIVTVYDFLKWFALTQEHGLAMNRLASLDWNDPSFIDDIFYFYNTEAFFRYSMMNSHEILPNNEWMRYKEHVRTYIEDFYHTKLVTKSQHASGWYSLYLKDIICCSFSDGKRFRYVSDFLNGGSKYADLLLS